MIYLIWGLINIALIVYFLVICFKATKLVKQKIGLFAAVFFVLGLLSLLGKPTKDSYSSGFNSNKMNSWNFASEDSLNLNPIFSLNVELEENWISKKFLRIRYGKHIQSQINIPINAYTFTTGYTGAIIWKPNSIIVNRTEDNNQFQYLVHIDVNWKLLGTTIYTQFKRFDGTISIEKSSR